MRNAREKIYENQLDSIFKAYSKFLFKNPQHNWFARPQKGVSNSEVKKIQRINMNMAIRDPVLIEFAKTMGIELEDDLKILYRVWIADKGRKYRLFKRIKEMLSKGECLWLTFTFDDKKIHGIDDERQLYYVKKWLRKWTLEYVLNVDYGVKNGRKHYHAIALVDKIVDYTDYEIGALNGSKINNKNYQALGNYIIKLTNHALKNSTKFEKIIFSRKYKKNF